MKTANSMTERQSRILKQIIESYAVNAEPVASGLLAKGSKVSSATIRNEMAVLEEEGYIEQPHTSAGRIPTIKGYQYYLQEYVKEKQPTEAQKRRLESASKSDRRVKELAKELSELTHQTVLVAFAKNDFYYTGISQLFAQPEFHQPDAVIDVSVVLDALDDALAQIYRQAGDGISILIGRDNPFSERCSLLIKRGWSADSQEGLIAILGPVRMHYDHNIGLLNYSSRLLSKIK